MSGRDMLRGVAWGVLVSCLVVAVISLLAPQPLPPLGPPPPRVAEAVEAPAEVHDGDRVTTALPLDIEETPLAAPPSPPEATAESAAGGPADVEVPASGPRPQIGSFEIVTAVPRESGLPEVGGGPEALPVAPDAAEPRAAAADALMTGHEEPPAPLPAAPEVASEAVAPIAPPRDGTAPDAPQAGTEAAPAPMVVASVAAPTAEAAPPSPEMAPAAPVEAAPEPATEPLAVAEAAPPAGPVVQPEPAPAAEAVPEAPATAQAPAPEAEPGPAPEPSEPIVIAEAGPEAVPAPSAVLPPVNRPAADSVVTAEAQPEPAPSTVQPRVLRGGGALNGDGGLPGKRAGRLTTQGEAAPVPEADAIPDAAAPEAESAGNSRPFENPMGKPLVSIILLAAGAAGETDLLGGLTIPVSIAIDASQPGAAAEAAAVRAAGQELVLATPLPAGAEPTDVAVALQGYLSALPEAVAVIEPTPGALQGSRGVAGQVVTELGRAGLGLVAFDSGLDPARQMAEKAGLPYGQVYRDIDGAGQDAAAIRRFIDQAAFRAAQEGRVILVGHLTAETLMAIDDWRQGGRSSSVELAPISAVLAGE